MLMFHFMVDVTFAKIQLFDMIKFEVIATKFSNDNPIVNLYNNITCSSKWNLL